MPFGSSSVSIPPPQLVNIPQTQQLAQSAAQQNVTGSLALQNQIFPGLNAAQNAGISSIANNNRNPVIFNPASASPYGGAPLLDQAGAYASNQLALGDQLPADVQAQVARQAGASAFGAGLRGNGLSGVTAADLGLNSLQLGQQRFSNVAAIGQEQQQASLAQQQLQTAVNEFNSQYGASVPLQNRAQNLAGSAFLAGIPAPAAGLSPGDVASLSVANNNTQNSYDQQVAELQAQQQNANNGFFGQLLGLGLGAAFAPLTGGASLAGSLFGGLGSLFNSTPSQYNADGSINLGG